jgi:hypothetical protein
MSESMSPTPYRLIPFSECVLYRLYEAHIHDDERDRYSVADICAMFKERVPRKLVVSALELLRGSRYDREKRPTGMAMPGPTRIR